MEFIKIGAERLRGLAELHRAYKAEIGESAPTGEQLESLGRAIEKGDILFFGCVWDGELVACCSVCVTYSTFNYGRSGVFEDFYILPEYRHRGIARGLAAFAYEQSGAESMTVGCADCDAEMYKAIGFGIKLGNMLAYSQ